MTPSQKPQDGGAAVRYEPHCDCLGGHVSMRPDPNGRWCRAEVKPLEWKDDEELSYAIGAGAEYLVELSHVGSWYCEDEGPFVTRADAKNAAQANYERRVLSALVEADHA